MWIRGPQILRRIFLLFGCLGLFSFIIVKIVSQFVHFPPRYAVPIYSRGVPIRPWTYNFTTLLEPNISTAAQWTANKSVLVCVTSSVEYTDKREAIRTTLATHPNLRLVFVVGENPPYQSNLTEESDKFGDILQFDFLDTYRNLTLKTTALILWAEKHSWQGRTHVMKIDDDTFINTNLLMKLLPNMTAPAIYGEVRKNHFPWRNAKPFPQWSISRSEYPPSRYPTFLPGGLYIIQEKAIHCLRQHIFTPMFIFLEDVYFTGLVAEVAGIERVDLPEWANFLSGPSYKNAQRRKPRRSEFIRRLMKDLSGHLGIHHVTAEDHRIYFKYSSLKLAKNNTKQAVN